MQGIYIYKGYYTYIWFTFMTLLEAPLDTFAAFGHLEVGTHGLNPLDDFLHLGSSAIQQSLILHSLVWLHVPLDIGEGMSFTHVFHPMAVRTPPGSRRCSPDSSPAQLP